MEEEGVEALDKVQISHIPKAKSKGAIIKESTSTKLKDSSPEVLKRNGKEIMV